MKKIVGLILIVLGVGLDQGVKAWIVSKIGQEEVRSVIPGFLSLTNVENTGAAWSSLEGQQFIFLILTPVVVLIAALFFWKKSGENWYFWGLSLIISGALGNYIDRLRLGHVVDMFKTEFINFPIFNVADSLLSFGFALLFIAILTDRTSEDGKNGVK